MMRLLIALLIALTAFPSVSKDISGWATAVSRKNDSDRVIIFRYAQSFREGFQRSDFPARLIIVWKYQSASGMPTPQERESMDRMEDLLEPLVEDSGASVLTLVSTGENLREWTFYAKSEQAFFAALNKALAGKPRFPVEIHAARDSAWTTYEQFRSGVRE